MVIAILVRQDRGAKLPSEGLIFKKKQNKVANINTGD